MSKAQLLFNVVSDLRKLADSIQSLAEELEGCEQTNTIQAETVITAQEPKHATRPVTLEQVRATLAEKSQDGFAAEVRALLEKHGASRLSEINPANYAALLADAEKLK